MASKLFEYVVLFQPKATKDAQGNDTTPPAKIIADVTRVLATSDKEVAIIAARAIPEEYTRKLDEVEISIRPF